MNSSLLRSVLAIASGAFLIAACSESNDIAPVAPVQDVRAEDGEGYDSATQDGQAFDVAEEAADAASDGSDSDIFGPTPWSDLDCSRGEPDFDCIQQILVPLEQMRWLVPSDAQPRIDPLGTTMGAEWLLSAIHRIAGGDLGIPSFCMLETFSSRLRR